MIFETLSESNKRGELMLVDGGMCHWHLRRDGQLTIREIIVANGRQRQGIGTMMLSRLGNVADADNIFAKCPADLPSNEWYEAMGFSLEGREETRSGRIVNKWRLQLK